MDISGSKAIYKKYDVVKVDLHMHALDITSRPAYYRLITYYLSVCLQMGCLPQCMGGYHTPRDQTPPEQTPLPEQTHTPREQRPPRSRHPPGADTPLEQTLPWEQTPPEQTPPRDRPPRVETTPPTPYPQQTATVADGTHPTEMHSCHKGASNKTLS